MGKCARIRSPMKDAILSALLSVVTFGVLYVVVLVLEP